MSCWLSILTSLTRASPRGSGDWGTGGTPAGDVARLVSGLGKWAFAPLPHLPGFLVPVALRQSSITVAGAAPVSHRLPNSLPCGSTLPGQITTSSNVAMIHLRQIMRCGGQGAI
ncbi:hypothetical protein GCM10007315_24820 [Gemmobacter tilapiae]|uniref:Uncharacterized protein n=1 Tax=Neogemmobacter tilapiae TaxID=875041 RepID=A0A918TSC3_9RHOB|nr:hypothetical protein GCM10007315_24820 [Gemmobacter tilapiae]